MPHGQSPLSHATTHAGFRQGLEIGPSWAVGQVYSESAAVAE